MTPIQMASAIRDLQARLAALEVHTGVREPTAPKPEAPPGAEAPGETPPEKSPKAPPGKDGELPNAEAPPDEE